MNAVVIVDPAVSPEEQAGLLQAIQDAEATIELGLGARAAVVSAGQPLLDLIPTLSGVSALVAAASDIPAGLDADTADLVVAWLDTQEPAFQAELGDPTRYGASWATFESPPDDTAP